MAGPSKTGEIARQRGEAATMVARKAGVTPSDPLASITRSLPAPLRSIPLPPMLAGGGLFTVSVVILLAMLARSPATIEALEQPEAASAGSASAGASPGTSAAPKAAPTTAPRAELDAAQVEGLSALGALGQRFPNDPAVLKALLIAQAGDPAGFGAATGLTRRILEIDPKAAEDDEIQKTLVTIANGPPETARAAFDLITTKLGSRGPDLLYEIAGAVSSSKLAKERAPQLLQDAEVKKLSSPALVIALELKASLPCARKALLPRARAEGDARALVFLKPLLVTRGCGFLARSDCYACFGTRADVKETVAAIEARAAKP